MDMQKQKREIPHELGETIVYSDPTFKPERIGGSWTDTGIISHYPFWPSASFYGYSDPAGFCIHHNYPHYALEIVECGELIVSLNDKENIVLHDGEAVIFLPGENSSFKVGPSGVCRKGSCTFSGELADAVFAAMGLVTTNILHPENPELLFDLIRRIANLIEQRRIGTEPELCGLGFQLLTQLSDALPRGHSDLFFRAKRLFAMSVPRKTEIRDLIRKLGTNANTLGKLFREQFGMTPGKYLFELRMSTAKKLLQQYEMRIGDVASRVGYDDQLVFSHAFKRRFGYSPTALRESKKAEPVTDKP